jgi:hypothetical protein
MVRINLNAMTNQEIIQQYRTLVEQAEVVKKNGFILGIEYTERIAILKEAMEALGLA